MPGNRTKYQNRRKKEIIERHINKDPGASHRLDLVSFRCGDDISNIVEPARDKKIIGSLDPGRTVADARFSSFMKNFRSMDNKLDRLIENEKRLKKILQKTLLELDDLNTRTLEFIKKNNNLPDDLVQAYNQKLHFLNEKKERLDRKIIDDQKESAAQKVQKFKNGTILTEMNTAFMDRKTKENKNGNSR